MAVESSRSIITGLNMIYVYHKEHALAGIQVMSIYASPHQTQIISRTNVFPLDPVW